MSTTPLFRLGALLGASLLATACGPDVRGSGGDDDPGECTPIAATETCGGGVDDDCDGFIDCEDLECIDSPLCQNVNPNCGTLDTPTASLALPDGVGCTDTIEDPIGLNASTGCETYDSAITFTGFSQGQQLEDISKLIGICATMEHSWIPDLQIEAHCPDGSTVVLNEFLGRSGSGELGIPDPSDSPSLPGTGWEYCWTPTATEPPMLEYLDAGGSSPIPAGNYQTSQSLAGFIGCPLNGDWHISVQDRWGLDNGFIFNWSVKFDPSIVEDCASWPLD